MTAPARVRQPRAGVLEIGIREGRKRQVRRMIEAVGHRVLELERVSFGPLGLRGLEPAQPPLSARWSGCAEAAERRAARRPLHPPRGNARCPRGRIRAA